MLYGAAKPKTVSDGFSSHIIDYNAKAKDILNFTRHQNCIYVSKVTEILLNGLILPIGGVALVRVCTCSLRAFF